MVQAANDNVCNNIAEVVERYAGGDGGLIVYALSSGDGDATSPEHCRYVGLTCQGLRARLSAHVTEASAKRSDGTFKYNTYRARWIRSVISEFGRDALRITPIVAGLSCDRSAHGAGAAEKDMIVAYRTAGAKLTNATSGGEGIPASGGEKRATKNAYMRAYMLKRRASDAEYAERQRASCRSSMKKRYANDNVYREAVLAKARERRATDDAFRGYMLDYGRAYKAKKRAEKQAA